jgi:DNA-binding PadR family transcriptional regulator
MMDSVRKSNLSLAILGLVSLNPLSGYDLRKIFTTTPMGHFSTSPGAIYPALRRLKARGLIRGRVRNKNTLRPKQTFVITGKGRMLLREVLSLPITSDDVKWNMDGLMLRFAFMGKILGEKRTLRFLSELAAKTKDHTVMLERHLERSRDKIDATAIYAQEHGIARYRATSQWAERTILNFGRG